MRWILKNLFRLLVLALIVFAGWAFFADLPPPSERITVDIDPPAAAGAGDAGN